MAEPQQIECATKLVHVAKQLTMNRKKNQINFAARTHLIIHTKFVCNRKAARIKNQLDVRSIRLCLNAIVTIFLFSLASRICYYVAMYTFASCQAICYNMQITGILFMFVRINEEQNENNHK